MPSQRPLGWPFALSGWAGSGPAVGVYGTPHAPPRASGQTWPISGAIKPGFLYVVAPPPAQRTLKTAQAAILTGIVALCGIACGPPGRLRAPTACCKLRPPPHHVWVGCRAGWGCARLVKPPLPTDNWPHHLPPDSGGRQPQPTPPSPPRQPDMSIAGHAWLRPPSQNVYLGPRNRLRAPGAPGGCSAVERQQGGLL